MNEWGPVGRPGGGRNSVKRSGASLRDSRAQMGLVTLSSRLYRRSPRMGCYDERCCDEYCCDDSAVPCGSWWWGVNESRKIEEPPRRILADPGFADSTVHEFCHRSTSTTRYASTVLSLSLLSRPHHVPLPASCSWGSATPRRAAYFRAQPPASRRLALFGA